MEVVSDELHMLQRGIRDLVALTALPAIWLDSQPWDIVRGLCDVVITTLPVDVVYACFPGMPHGTPNEFLRTREQYADAAQTTAIGKKLSPWLNIGNAGLDLSISDPFGSDLLQIVVASLGHEGADGFLVAGTRAPHLLTDLDRLLLSVAANQAIVALQQAKLLTDLRIANKLKFEFLAMISHELRTPLASIKGFSSTLLATDVKWDEDNQRQFITIIGQESEKLTNLIIQLLDLSQLQAGTFRIAPMAHSMPDILDSIMVQLTSLAQNHRLTIRLAPDLPPVMADPRRIAEVINNLVGNAVKYAPQGTTIYIEGAVRDGVVKIDVSDEGPGIPLENRESVFEAFRQLKRESSQQPTGAGLGLALSKGLIEAHYGRIWIGDSLPTGAIISFTLPLAVIDGA